MKFDVKKLTKEELENLLIALTFGESTFYWHNDPRNKTHHTMEVYKTREVMEKGRDISKVIELLETHFTPSMTFRCKDIADELQFSYQYVSGIMKTLYVRGLVDRFVKEEVIYIPTEDYEDEDYEEVITKPKIVKVSYYKLAKGV